MWKPIEVEQRLSWNLISFCLDNRFYPGFVWKANKSRIQRKVKESLIWNFCRIVVNLSKRSRIIRTIEYQKKDTSTGNTTDNQNLMVSGFCPISISASAILVASIRLLSWYTNLNSLAMFKEGDACKIHRVSSCIQWDIRHASVSSCIAYDQQAKYTLRIQ